MTRERIRDLELEASFKSNSEIIGWFWEDEVYYHGELQPMNQTPIIAQRGPTHDNKINVLSEEGNWYKVDASDLTLFDN